MSEEWKDSVQVGMEHRIQESECDAQKFTHLKMPRNANSNLHEEEFRHPLLQKDCFDKQICCSIWQKPEIKLLTGEKGDEDIRFVCTQKMRSHIKQAKDNFLGQS